VYDRVVGATGDGIEFILREGYLEALHLGTYSEHPYKKFIAGSIQACKDHGVDLLFVDISGLSGFTDRNEAWRRLQG